MIENITYKDPNRNRALGRNGLMKQIGLEVYVSELHNAKTTDIAFRPINSKGNAGRCSLEIPVEHLDELIKVLQNIKDGRSD